VYRIKYIDDDNDPPKSDYPKVHILKGGNEISGSPFIMNYVSGDTITGMIYSYSTILSISTDYTYYFETYDIYNANTTTLEIDAPDVTNTVPQLSWTGEAGYEEDGINPDKGSPVTNFIYRVKYTDVDNHPPKSGYPKLHILKSGIEITESPFIMDDVDSVDDTYSDGKLYTYTISGLAPGTDYTYYFKACDTFDTVATGTPTFKHKFSVYSENLGNVIVYPNPWKSDMGVDVITFSNLTENCKIQIYTIAGELVFEVKPDNIDYQWDLKNEKGKKVASGVYLYIISNDKGEKKTGKIVIIR
jgi:hypothetical protein